MRNDTPTPQKMKTNDLKKGTRILLRNGWEAELWDNKKGNTRVALVFGDFTEAGSVYSHDIVGWIDTDGFLHDVEHTDSQIRLRQDLSAMGWF